jgi:hypothetical protein
MSNERSPAIMTKALKRLSVPLRKPPGRTIATMTHIGEALGINVLACEKEVSSAAEVHVLLYVYLDLLHVQRCTVFHETGMNDHMVG